MVSYRIPYNCIAVVFKLFAGHLCAMLDNHFCKAIGLPHHCVSVIDNSKTCTRLPTALALALKFWLVATY
jgi:hypothetical protein